MSNKRIKDDRVVLYQEDGLIAGRSKIEAWNIVIERQEKARTLLGERYGP